MALGLLRQYPATIASGVFFLIGLALALGEGILLGEAAYLLMMGIGTVLTLSKKFTIPGLAIVAAGFAGLAGILPPTILAILLVLFVPLTVVMR